MYTIYKFINKYKVIYTKKCVKLLQFLESKCTYFNCVFCFSFIRKIKKIYRTKCAHLRWLQWLQCAYQYFQHGVLRPERPTAKLACRAQGGGSCAGAHSWTRDRGWRSAVSLTCWGRPGRNVQPKSGRRRETEETPDAQCQTWPRFSKDPSVKMLDKFQLQICREISKVLRRVSVLWDGDELLKVRRNPVRKELPELSADARHENLWCSTAQTTFLTWVRCEFHPLAKSRDSPVTTHPHKTGSRKSPNHKRPQIPRLI